jgi:hypothetical protein
MQDPTRRSAAQRLFVALAMLLARCSGLAWEPAVLAQQKEPAEEIPPAAARDQPSPPGEPPAAIEGFRDARFGMSEEQVRQAIRKDFPSAAAKLASAVHPSEKTTVLSIAVPDLLPDTGVARISYIFGYRSKQLIQINVVWTSTGNATSDETIIATANSLRDYFAPQNYQPDSVVANRQLADATIVVFRANDRQGRTVLLALSGATAAARSEEKKPPQPPPLTLKLSYILDAAHPDIFRITKGQF